MDEKSLFTGFWRQESKTTSKVLARIPEGSDYRPDPKSRTAREIAWQIVGEEKMIIEALETGTAEWAPVPAPASMKEVCDAYDRQSADIMRRWRRCRPRGGTARSSSSAVSGPRRRWRGASCSISCTTGARSRPTCARWDRPCRRCTVPARTNPDQVRGSADRPGGLRRCAARQCRQHQPQAASVKRGSGISGASASIVHPRLSATTRTPNPAPGRERRA